MSDKTNFSIILDPIISLIEHLGIEAFATDTVCKMVLGVLPNDDSEKAKQLMEFSRRDTTEQKVEHIAQLTVLAELFTQRPVYTMENLTDFTYALRQLSRYAFDDEIATSALSKLKDLYIKFLTDYYYESLNFGKKEEALKNLKHFGEEILKEDKDICRKLKKIATFKPLN
jgi:hypothetical protein